MKRLFKKIVTVVAAVATVFAMTTTAFADEPAVRVAGDEALTGKAWSTTDNEMTANGDGTYTITFKDVKAGEYGFKVVKGDSWGDAYNLEGAANGMGDDAKVKVEADGSSVTITFDGTKASVEVKAASTDAPSTDAPAADEKPADKAPVTGDAVAVVAMVAVAAVAGAMVVASRRQTANN